jgi:hypothetical protein
MRANGSLIIAFILADNAFVDGNAVLINSVPLGSDLPIGSLPNIRIDIGATGFSNWISTNKSPKTWAVRTV